MSSLPSPRKILLAIAALATVATAKVEGVGGCHGSWFCKWWKGGHAIKKLEMIIDTAVDSGAGSDYFKSGQHIACTKKAPFHGGWCAFFQKGLEGDLYDVQEHLSRLDMWGCDNCGSSPEVPGGYVENGMLTVNYVAHMNCDPGYCGPKPLKTETDDKEGAQEGARTDNWDRDGFDMDVDHA